MRHLVEVYVDGAVKAGIPVWGCLFMRDGVPVDADGGLSPTRGSSKARIDFAEYHALINGLERIRTRAWDQDVVTFYTDNEIVYGQITERKKTSEELLPLHKKVLELIDEIKTFRLVRISRNDNKVADRITEGAFKAAALAKETKPDNELSQAG